MADASWWTEVQDDVLCEASFRGAAYAAEIERGCGVRHSVRAMGDARVGIHRSLALQSVFPECGAVGVKINRQTGMCPLWTERYRLEQELALNEQLERKRAYAEESAELEAVRRKRDMIRQRNSRLCREYGLTERWDRGRTK